MFYKGVSGQIAFVHAASGCAHLAVVKLIIILNYSSSCKWQLSHMRTCKFVVDGSRSVGSR